MSLIEVMIALTVLTLGLCAVMSHYVTLYDMRRHTAHLAHVQEVVRNLSERIEACDGWALGRVVAVPGASPQYLLPWSLPRFVGRWDIDGDLTADDFPPMTEAMLRNSAYAILQGPIDMPDLKVYCEYYRLEHDPIDANRKGLLDLFPAIGKNEDTALPGDLPKAFAANPTIIAKSRIDPRFPPMLDVPDHQSIVVRIVATWGDPAQQRYEVFTAKRRIPLQQ